MATVIQIKRSQLATAPTTGALSEAELAFTQDRAANTGGVTTAGALYIKSADATNADLIQKIASAQVVADVEAATSTNVANTIVKRDGSGNLSANVITASTFIGAVTGNAATASALETARDITLTGDATGTASFDGSANASIAVTIAAGSIEESMLDSAIDADTLVLSGSYSATSGTVSSGDTIETAIEKLAQATGQIVQSSWSVTGDTGSDTINDAESIAFTGGTGVTTAVTNNEVTISLDGVTADELTLDGTYVYNDATGGPTHPAISDTVQTAIEALDGNQRHLITTLGTDLHTELQVFGNSGGGSVDLGDGGAAGIEIKGNASGAITTEFVDGDDSLVIRLKDTAVTAGSYGSTSEIPIITVDSQGRLTAASTTSINTSSNIAGDTGTDNVTSADTLTFTGGTGITTAVTDNTVTLANDGVLSLTGTANEVEVDVSTGAITIGLPDDVTISGNLTVSGTTTTVNSTSIEFGDSTLHFGAGNLTADVVDTGAYGVYSDDGGSSVTYHGFFRDASDSGKYKFVDDLSVEPGTTFDLTGASTSTIVANLEGDLTGDILGVTVNSLLVGAGSGAATELSSATQGHVLQINGSGAPSFGMLDGGSF